MDDNAFTIRVPKDKKLKRIGRDNDSRICGNSYRTGRKNRYRALGGASFHNQEQNGYGMNAPYNAEPPFCDAPDGTEPTKTPDPDQDVFILRIGKKGENKKNDLEIEMRTPKGPDLKPRPMKETRDTQWDDADAGWSEAPAKKKKKKRKKGGAGGDKKEYSPPNYGNPHIIGTKPCKPCKPCLLLKPCQPCKPCRPCKSFSPCSSYYTPCPTMQSPACSMSGAYSCQSYGSYEPYNYPSGMFRNWC